MKFTESHEWIKVERDHGVVGLSNHAQHELGEIVYVELPKVGKLVKAGEEVAVVESTKAATDIYSPVSGEILAVNEVLRPQPELINDSPEELGWLFKIRLTHPNELEQLLDADAYESRFRRRL